MKTIKIFALIITVFLTSFLSAQPTGYYNGTEGKSGEELKSALNEIISGHTVYSYFFSKEIFKLSDADPNNPNNVIMVYTGRSHPNNDYGNGSNQLNREHVWAKSHGNFDGVQPMNGDVHNLKPVDASVNIDRSNKDFDNGGTQHPEATGCYYTDATWEPRDEVKGDIARIILYMDVRYEGKNGELDLMAVDEVNTYPYPKHGRLSTLLEWNLMDPPDDFERNRNNVIYSFQNNRNPFIDNPHLAELIWSGAQPSAISVANVRQEPVVPQASVPITIFADISSTAGNITDATLYYGYSFQNLTEELDMEGSGSSLYAVIPGQNQNTRVYFRIEAQDGSNTFSTVTYNFYVPRTFTGTLTSIYDIQGQAASSPYAEQVVSTTGVVTANFGTNYFLQDGEGAWNGLFIYDPGRNPSVGDSLILTGTITEYYGKTEMKSITGYYFISANNALPAPVNITCAEADEPYEGVLVRVDNATCTDPNYWANFYMWTVNDGTGDLLIHNTNVFEYEPKEGDAYDITGPLDYDFDEWKIQLRFETDVQSGVDNIPPQVSSLDVITSTVLKLQFSEEVDQASAETLSNYSINNNVVVQQASVHSIVKSQVFLTVSPLEGGDYELTVQNIADLAGNVMPVTVVPFSSTGIYDHVKYTVVNVFPNPSQGLFQMRFSEEMAGNAMLKFYSLTGHKVHSQEINFNEELQINVDVSHLSCGVYFVEIAGDAFASRFKVIIY
ncbi:MAG: endonuclease [Bacteroidales bacterium]|nr:endonuclease [Bacteroidales bacterium]